MKKFISIVLSFALLVTSCSERMVGVISSTTPKKVESSRVVTSINGYEVKSQNQFEFSIDREEEVKYATSYEERQKWHNPNPYTTYPLMAGGFGYLSYLIFTTEPSENDEAGDYATSIVLGIVSAGLSLGGILSMFSQPVTRIKSVTKSGNPIFVNEYVKASNETFTTKIENQAKKAITDFSGKLSINPYDFRFPVLTEHQDFQLSFSKGRFQNFGTATINSSRWMKEYGVIKSDPVKISGSLNTPFFSVDNQLGVGSTIYENEPGYSLLKINNSDTWINPEYLNVFYYSSQKELGSIPALKNLNYNKNRNIIIEEQKKILDENLK